MKLTPPSASGLAARVLLACGLTGGLLSPASPVHAARAQPAVAPQSSPADELAPIRGKGAWFMMFNGDWRDPDADRADALVDSAVRSDLSHLYVRVADSRRHFYAAAALRDLLPAAHAHGLSLIGWIEPQLDDPVSDAADAIAAARFREQGQRLDGLALTIEGHHTGDPWVARYLSTIRNGVAGLSGLGSHYLLVASTYPNPSAHQGYAYRSLSRYCQAFSPMAYWRATGRPQDVGVDGARRFVAQIFTAYSTLAVNPFARPLSITAQAYDAIAEAGTPGSPSAAELVASMEETRSRGGIGWSFYRLPDDDNGVTAGEAAAVTAYPYWHRAKRGGV